MGRSVFEQLQFSEVLVAWRHFFNFLAAQQGKSELMLLEQKLELGQLKVCLPRPVFDFCLQQTSKTGSAMLMHDI